MSVEFFLSYFCTLQSIAYESTNNYDGTYNDSGVETVRSDVAPLIHYVKDRHLQFTGASFLTALFVARLASPIEQVTYRMGQKSVATD